MVGSSQFTFLQFTHKYCYVPRRWLLKPFGSFFGCQETLPGGRSKMSTWILKTLNLKLAADWNVAPDFPCGSYSHHPEGMSRIQPTANRLKLNRNCCSFVPPFHQTCSECERKKPPNSHGNLRSMGISGS